MQGESLSVREIAIADAEAVAELSGELGYPVSPVTMEERIRFVMGQQDHAVFVASVADALVGWIDVGIVHHLHAGLYAEISGLVVSSAFRGAGVGRELVRQAERFAQGCKVAKVVLRSQITREAAHRFYLREGYERTKTSAVFSKLLGQPRSEQ